MDARKRRLRGEQYGQQLCVSLRSDVVQIRTGGCRQGTTQGCRGDFPINLIPFEEDENCKERDCQRSRRAREDQPQPSGAR